MRLDWFAGVAHVSAAFQSLGHEATPFDIKDGASFDITDARVLAFLLRKLRQGEFDGVKLAPPCATFSIARHPASRLSQYPWGLSEAKAHPQLLCV